MKRLVKILFSTVFYFILILIRTIASVLGRRQQYYIVVYYHNVKKEQKVKFSRQMDIIKKISTLVSAETGVKCTKEKSKKRNIFTIVTFDDVYKSVVENAIPVLMEKNIPFTLFIPTAYLGKAPVWDDIASDIKENETIIDAEQLKKLNSDLISVGSHSVSHPKFTQLSEDQINSEFIDSKYALESLLGKKIKLFSFPYGIYNNELIKTAISCGYEKIFTIDPAVSHDYIQKKIIGRLSVSPDDWPTEFFLKLSGGYQWMDYYRLLKNNYRNIVYKLKVNLRKLRRESKSLKLLHH